MQFTDSKRAWFKIEPEYVEGFNPLVNLFCFHWGRVVHYQLVFPYKRPLLFHSYFNYFIIWVGSLWFFVVHRYQSFSFPDEKWEEVFYLRHVLLGTFINFNLKPLLAGCEYKKVPRQFHKSCGSVCVSIQDRRRRMGRLPRL